MPRANRISSAGLVWHITHRCHQKAFLLKFARDRRRWRHWLFVAQRRYGLSVLNYVATSNHVHLLCADMGNGEISRSVQLAAARTGQEFNTRKRRRGAFWEGRFHTTAVETDSHLARCMTYIDLNMVRAGAVAHPSDWDICGYNEIQSPWRRKGIIDFEALQRILGVRSPGALARRLDRLMVEQLGSTARNPVWTESVAVGSDAYLQTVAGRLGTRGLRARITDHDGQLTLRERGSAYFPFSGLKLRIKRQNCDR